MLRVCSNGSAIQELEIINSRWNSAVEVWDYCIAKMQSMWCRGTGIPSPLVAGRAPLGWLWWAQAVLTCPGQSLSSVWGHTAQAASVTCSCLFSCAYSAGEVEQPSHSDIGLRNRHAQELCEPARVCTARERQARNPLPSHFTMLV